MTGDCILAIAVLQSASLLRQVNGFAIARNNRLRMRIGDPATCADDDGTDTCTCDGGYNEPIVDSYFDAVYDDNDDYNTIKWIPLILVVGFILIIIRRRRRHVKTRVQQPVYVENNSCACAGKYVRVII